jgi:hypothetical protein
MTPEHAHNLAVRYKNIWRGGPPVEELTTQLADYDFDAACAAVSRLAREHDTPPTIRQLHTAIRGNTPTAYGWEPPEDTGPPTALDDVIARLERKQRDGTGSDNDLADLQRWRRLRADAVARHPSCPNTPSST